MNRKFLAATVAFTLVAGNAQGANKCVREQDELAMRTASVQQALMVAALSCGETASYNRFVVSHQTELQRSDASLLAFFLRENRRAGEAAYHAFKTKAPNESALEAARDNGNYCANSERLFTAAFDPSGSDLETFVSNQWPATAEIVQARCTVDTSRVARSKRYESPVPASPPEPTLANNTDE